MLKPTVLMIVLIGLVGPVSAQETEQNVAATRGTIKPPADLPLNLSTDGTRVIRTKDGAEMIYVPAGPFRMGHTRAEYEVAMSDAEAQGVREKPGYDGRGVAGFIVGWVPENRRVPATAKELFWSEMSAIELTLPAYLIDKHEVSNTQYMSFIKDTGHRRPKSDFGKETTLWKKGGFPPGLDHHPVVNVTVRHAREYCEWVRSRLPTEAEWEKAARGSEGLVYPWGNQWVPGRANHGRIQEAKYPPKLRLGEDPSDGCESTCPSGEHAVDEGGSPYGVQDMAGNVWEWVDETHVSTNVARTPNDEHVLAPGAIRGGSYMTPPVYLRTTTRVFVDGGYRYPTVGFRCAQSFSVETR